MQKIKINISIFSIQDRDLFTTLRRSKPRESPTRFAQVTRRSRSLPHSGQCLLVGCIFLPQTFLAGTIFQSRIVATKKGNP